jgi:DNA-binding NarL/FixJ family response regulator
MEPNMERIRIVVAEDERLTRDALVRLLSLEDDIEVIGQAADGENALRVIREKMPDVLLTDIEMPKMNGIELTQKVLRDHPTVRVCILTIYHDDGNVFRAIKAGATGYILKDSPIEETVTTLRVIAEGGSRLHPGIASRVLAEFNRIARQRAADLSLFSELTDREIEVLKEVATGKRNKEIADVLFISEKTVKNHISAILMKLQVNDRTEAAMMAARGGLVDP